MLQNRLFLYFLGDILRGVSSSRQATVVSPLYPTSHSPPRNFAKKIPLSPPFPKGEADPTPLCKGGI